MDWHLQTRWSDCKLIDHNLHPYVMILRLTSQCKKADWGEEASVSENQQQVINARPVLIKALLIALLGESHTLLCSLTDS